MVQSSPPRHTSIIMYMYLLHRKVLYNLFNSSIVMQVEVNVKHIYMHVIYIVKHGSKQTNKHKNTHLSLKMVQSSPPRHTSIIMYKYLLHRKVLYNLFNSYAS